MTQKTAFFPLQGGLNLVTPAIRTPSGNIIAGVNYEPVERGYRRNDGFERFDGRPKPSAATYWILNFDGGTGAFVEGEIATGAGGATGECLIDAVIESGSFAGNNAVGYLVLVNGTGTFVNNEALTGSTVGVATVNGTSTNRGATNDTDDATYHQDAIETTRADIAVVTGSGVIRGVWVYNGDTYAIRDNAGATAAVLFKATTAGWVAQTLGYKIAFTSGGTTAIAEGNTVTGDASGATGTVGRVIVTSGTWAGGDAAGSLILTAQTGTFQSENLEVSAVNLATIAGDSTANTLPNGGRYDFVNHNFYGASNLERMYGCQGVGTAFEWDGSVFVPLPTGMTTDTPQHISVYKNHLSLSFPGGSTQKSGIGDPYAWTVITGASELAMGQDITGFVRDVARSEMIFCRNKVGELFGNDSTDFVLNVLADDAGAIEWTMQMIGKPIYLDDRGLRNTSTTQAYGDFKQGTLTQIVEPLFRTKRAAGVTAVASLRCRAKDQYRLYWSDNTGITVYLGRKQPEVIPFDLGKRVYAICSSEDSSGDEIMFFGSDDGYVYQIDSGTSYDGSAVSAYLRLPFNHIGTPTQNKRFHKATLEIDASPSAVLGVLADFSYAHEDLPESVQQDFTVTGGGAFWDESTWDEFYWDSSVEGLAEAYIDGFGKNVSIAIVSSATYEDPHTIHGVTLHYSSRGLAR